MAGLVSGLDSRVEVYTAARDLPAGEVVEEADLRVARIAIDPALGDGLQADLIVVGEQRLGDGVDGVRFVTRGPIGAGSLLAWSDVSLQTNQETKSLVGVILDAGRYPGVERVTDDVEGDTVTLLRIGDAGPSIVTSAVVVQAASQPDGGSWFITLEVTDEMAPSVAQLAADGRLAISYPLKGQ